MDDQYFAEIEAVIRQVREYPVSLKQVAHESGLGHHWLKALVYGYMKEPSYVKIRRLQDFFK